MFEAHDFQQISSDAFKSWSRCKKQFYYKHIKHLQWPSDVRHFRLGRDVHKLLDYQARGLDCEVLLSNAPGDVLFSWRKLEKHPITKLPVIANEWAFHVPVPLGNGQTEWLTGRLDRVARDGDSVVIIDWKTGTGIPKQPETDWQTLLYLYGLLEVANSPSASDLGLNLHGSLRAEQIQFMYVEIKPDESTPIRPVTVKYSVQKHQQIGALLKQHLLQMSEEEDFPLPDACPDRYCAFRAICGIDVASGLFD